MIYVDKLEPIRQLERQGKLKQALKRLINVLQEIGEEAIYVEGLHLKGRLHHRMGKLKEAIKTYQDVLNIDPRRINTMNNLAAALISSQNLNAAREILNLAWSIQNKRDLREDPNVLKILMNTEMQWNLHQQRFNDALRLATQIVLLEPNAQSLANLSVCQRWVGQPEKAVRASTQSIALAMPGEPDWETLELNHGTMQLACDPNDYQGWKTLNARLGKNLNSYERQHMEKTIWEGNSCHELCLWDEQGYGDTFMALRWLPNALKRCTKGTLVVRKSMIRLLKKRLTLPDHCEILAIEEIENFPWRQASTHIPLMSLPGIIPAEEVERAPKGNYLKCLNEGTTRRGVGIVWAAGKKDDAEAERMRVTRNLPAEKARELLKMSKTIEPFFALQLGEELKEAANYSKITIPPKPTDWEETAALLEKIEVVISVDTAMAHLAGALGIPTILLLNQPCDWRWGQNTNSTMLWYKDMKILRCDKFNGWDTVLERILEEVSKIRGL
tara:strand:+ start:14924 stop:16423 length:1500 start_codon:yes stop_codon:yes gene_type:complete